MPWEIRVGRSRWARPFMGRLHQAQTMRIVAVRRGAREPAVESESVEFTWQSKHANRKDRIKADG
jgi:hypothetical protein